ncbi:MAG: hypothetical protein EOO04_33570 [Chitinophagaceae bacterium]|nr:MAG: hypothetical protein EOO04_33570 [Chitinophagaceae bacterium]
MLSAYADKQEANYHELELASKEGKMQNLLELGQYQTVAKLLKNETGITVFYNGTIDARHEKRLQKAYVKSVSGNIHYIRMKKEDHYDAYIC